MLDAMPTRRLLGRPTTLLVALLTGGCAVPFASPPVQVQGGVSVRRIERPGRPDAGTDVPGQLKVGVHPLGLLRSWTRRRVDVGAGYVGDLGGTQTVHGAYAEVAPTLLTATRGPIRRWLLRGQGRVLHASGQSGLGYGGAIQLSAEVGGFVPGEIAWRPTTTSGAAGYGWGESTIGLYAELGYSQIDSLRATTLTGGIQWRLPASVGLLFAGLGDDRRGREIQRRQREDEQRETSNPNDEPVVAPADPSPPAAGTPAP